MITFERNGEKCMISQLQGDKFLTISLECDGRYQNCGKATIQDLYDCLMYYNEEWHREPLSILQEVRSEGLLEGRPDLSKRLDEWLSSFSKEEA